MHDVTTKFLAADGRHIKLHGPDDFEGMRRAGKLAADCLDFITPHVKPQVFTGELDKLCHDFIVGRDAVPAPLNYRGFPKSICTSINHVVCHGIPGDKTLQKGDILNIDVTVILDGWHGDTSRMFPIGKVGVKAKKLMDLTFEAMWEGIKAVRPGATLGDIGHAIQSHAEAKRYGVVRDFCGHGLGQVFHDAPNVMHYGEAGQGDTLREGMFFTIEPMINTGGYEVKILDDGWTAVTKDRSLSAQFEHSIGVTEDGYEVFTLSPEGLDRPPYDV
ncbi:MAG: type I methionyl aminopeptidase [Rhodospirillales bacterium]